MAAPKKRKIASECRRFQTRWEIEYFFKEINGKCVCLICNEDVAVMKEYNVRQQKTKQMAAMSAIANHDKNATTASYEVAKLIAQHGKPFSDGDFIKQCLMKVTDIMCPEKVQDFNNVSLSRNTVVRRIEDLSANLKLQLRDKACAFDFYLIACDESTDAIFEAVSEAAEKMGLKWDKLCGVTTDGAPAMTGERKGMASMVCAKVKESGGEAVRMHCIIHQEALCAKTVQLGRGLYHREFRAFLSDVDAEYRDVLYHSDVRWLSRGSVLQRFYSLRSEIDQFLKEKGRPLHELSDPLWLADLAFLVDLTHHLNTLNKNLQGKEQLVPHLYAHMKAFCVKLRLFETQLRSFNAAHFPALSEIKSAFPKADISAKKEKYVSVIASLVTEFNQRFQDFSVIEKQIKLFSTPFLVDAEEVEESLQLELIEMQFDDSLKSQHQLLSLPDFYQSLDNAKFPLMRRHAKRMMSLFGSTYICEQTFSLLNQNKSRLRTRMTDSHLCEVLRVSTTKLSPDMSAILQSKGQLTHRKGGQNSSAPLSMLPE
uniref:SPIN-DOC-like zinc-finger domain-containing protein n=1 Tax=Seriola dumerili TaxID=41447 RepID=A0A3B4VC50_SERDU